MPKKKSALEIYNEHVCSSSYHKCNVNICVRLILFVTLSNVFFLIQLFLYQDYFLFKRLSYGLWDTSRKKMVVKTFCEIMIRILNTILYSPYSKQLFFYWLLQQMIITWLDIYDIYYDIIQRISWKINYHCCWYSRRWRRCMCCRGFVVVVVVLLLPCLL